MTRKERFESMRASRHNSIVDSATFLALRDGLGNISRDAVAARAGVANGSISAAFGGMPQLKAAIVEHAVQERNLPLIAQAIALKQYDALIPKEIRQIAACSLA